MLNHIEFHSGNYFLCNHKMNCQKSRFMRMYCYGQKYFIKIIMEWSRYTKYWVLSPPPHGHTWYIVSISNNTN